MKTSDTGIALIKSREGCRLTAYTCPAGVLTIGYGHTGDVAEGEVIDHATADMLLARDLARFERCVTETCPKATQAQFDAMVCLAFNIGCGAFAKSSVARLHNAGEYAQSGQAFALWNKAGGRVNAGLVSRRAAEAALYLTDCPSEPEDVPSVSDGEKPLSASRTINGTAITTIATGAPVAASVIPHDALDTLKEAFGNLVGVWDYAAYALAGLGVLGLAMTAYGRFKDRQEGRS